MTNQKIEMLSIGSVFFLFACIFVDSASMFAFTLLMGAIAARNVVKRESQLKRVKVSKYS